MDNPNQLPPGREPLSDAGDGKRSEILPKHKAIILYWMWNADEASKDPTNANDKDLINRFAPIIAGEFSWFEHKIMLSTPSIVKYYRDAKMNAMDYGLGLPWDVWTVANIIRSQVNDQETYTEKEHLSPQARKVMTIVLDTVRQTSKTLRDCWSEVASSGMPSLDPKLRQIHDFNPVPITFAKIILDEASQFLFG